MNYGRKRIIQLVITNCKRFLKIYRIMPFKHIYKYNIGIRHNTHMKVKYAYRVQVDI